MLRICTTIELSQCRFFKGAFWDKRDPVEWLAEIRASLLYKDRLINFFSPVNCDGGGSLRPSSVWKKELWDGLTMSAIGHPHHGN
jgi:hypothetical protein